jgi:hypothetical protein
VCAMSDSVHGGCIALLEGTRASVWQWMLLRDGIASSGNMRCIHYVVFENDQMRIACWVTSSKVALAPTPFYVITRVKVNCCHEPSFGMQHLFGLILWNSNSAVLFFNASGVDLTITTCLCIHDKQWVSNSIA